MERRTLADDLVALVSPELEARGFGVAFTERTGGASTGPYASLNLDARRDAPAAVAENRRRVAAALDISGATLGEQPHGSGVVRVGRSRAGAGWGRSAPSRSAPIGGADALETRQPGITLGILTADCLPVVLASPKQELLSVVHAGWRGLAAGVLGRAVASFGSPGSVRAVIGPAIGPDHYEVGEDVALAVASGSDAGAVTERRGGSVYLDLGATAAKVLRAAGVRTIDRFEGCTACEEDRFFSHRRDGETGRHALLATRWP